MPSICFNQVLRHNINDQSVAAMVANALHAEHVGDTAIAKRISRITGVNTHTISKWYQAVNAPNAAHLLMLSGLYPEVLKGVLELIGRHDVWELCDAHRIPGAIYASVGKEEPEKEIYRVKYVPINVTVPVDMVAKLNHRQLWFIGELQKGKKLRTQHIMQQWQVSPKTAKRDIATMLDCNAIRYHGARKNGYYVLA